MRRVIHSVLLMSFLVLVAIFGSAQTTEDSWDNLKQLRNGQKIEVVDVHLKSIKGTFASYSGEAISLRVGKDLVTVPRTDVFRVSDRGTSHRARNSLIGLALGATFGAAIAGCTLESPCEWPPGQKSAIGAGAGATAGALVGAALPGNSTIYRARKPRPGAGE